MIKSSEFGKNARQARQNKPAGRIYVPSGWKHYVMCRKTLWPTFVSRGKTVVFFQLKGEKTVPPRKTNVLLRVFFVPTLTYAQDCTSGYIFSNSHTLSQNVIDIPNCTILDLTYVIFLFSSIMEV